MNRRDRRLAKRQAGRRPRNDGPDIMAPVFDVPDNPMAALSRAGQLHQAGRFNQAEALYLEVAERWPDTADAPHWLGVLAFQRGDAIRAVDLIGRAIAIDGGNPQFHYHLGEAHRAAGDRPAAASAYRRAIDLAPQVSDPHFGLGMALLDDDDVDGAIASLTTAVDLSPNDPEARTQLANAHLRQGDPEAATAQFRQALRIDPNFAPAREGLEATQTDKQGAAP